jgi:spore germination protein YaaH
MAYDQIFQVQGAKEWRSNSGSFYAPNADIRWVEKVVKYAIKKINAKKVVLGIPTYGWEFIVRKSGKGLAYKRKASVSYSSAMELAKVNTLAPVRDETGELHFEYEKEGEKRLVWFCDSISVRQKVELAKKYHLGGIMLFKMDGLGDKKIFPIFRDAKVG